MISDIGLTISVVIPTFNAEQTIIRALESVKAQKLQPFEVIVVDDGSKDRTGELVKKNFPLAKYIRQDNAGPSAARNIGAKAAKGEWIAFLDDDDEWLPTKLSRQTRLLKAAPSVSLCFTGMVNINMEEPFERLAWSEDDFSLLKSISKDIHTGRILSNVFYFEMLCRNYIYTPTVIVRRSQFFLVGGFNQKLKKAEDVDLWLKLIKLGEVTFIEDPLVHRHFKPGGLSNDTWECEKNLLRVYKSYYSGLIEFPRSYRKKCNEALARLHRMVGLGYLDRGDTISAKKYFFISYQTRKSCRAVLFLVLPYLSTFGRRILRKLMKIVSPKRSFAGELIGFIIIPKMHKNKL